MPFLILVEKESVQVVLLQIHGEEGAYLLMLLGSLFGVSSVHFCRMCSARHTSISYISQTPDVMGDRWIFLCQLVHLDGLLLGPNQFWVANHDMLSIFGSDREFYQSSLWYISSSHCGQRNALLVLQFHRTEHHEVVFSWWHSLGLRQRPIASGEDVGWILFLLGNIHKCKKLFLDSNEEAFRELHFRNCFELLK